MSRPNWENIWYELDGWKSIHVHASEKEIRNQLEKIIELHVSDFEDDWNRL